MFIYIGIAVTRSALAVSGSCPTTKKSEIETSLVVQWLRFCSPNAGGWGDCQVQSLVRELDPTYHN